nr:MAG TPA: hypothetical protein [Caudoviricetes sp.]
MALTGGLSGKIRPQKILHGTNGRKQRSGEFPAVTLQSLLSGRELTVAEAKLLESRQLAALSTFFTKLRRFCLTPASPKLWRINGADWRIDMTTLRMIPGITYTRKNLEALTGMPDRANRHMIRAQRRQGVPIVALPDGGYKLAETDEEKKMLLAMYRKRALDELGTYHRLAKAMQVDGQMEVAGDETL